MLKSITYEQCQALRRGKGLSQRELAAKLNTTREAIDYYERRAQNPTLDLIPKAGRSLRDDGGRVAGK